MSLEAGWYIIQQSMISTCVNGSATYSLTLNITILTTNNITGSVGTFSWIACTGTSGRPLTPTAQGVYIVIASVGSAAIEICSTG